MSYRNDHEAALARIDVLEQELERLRTPPAPPPPPPRRRRAALAYLGALTLCAGGIGTIAAIRHARSAEVPEEAAVAEKPASLDALRPCVAKLRATHISELDAAITDPHGRSHAAIAPIEATGASCRRELAELVHGIGLTDRQRAAFATWLATEDELAGDLSRMTVYYASDPYALDGYATANQLWSEYRVDLAARDAVLPAVVRELQLPNV